MITDLMDLTQDSRFFNPIENFNGRVAPVELRLRDDCAVRFTRFARSSGLISGFLLPEFRLRGLKKDYFKIIEMQN